MSSSTYCHQRSSRQYPRLKRRLKGVVVVFALFITALAAGLAYYMATQLNRDIMRLTLMVRAVQAEAYAGGSIAWAMNQLKENWIKQKSGQLIDSLPLSAKEEVVNGYHIKSTIYDMQARFNLNNLSNPANQADFKRLLHAVNPTLPLTQIDAVIQASVNWISPGQNDSASSQYYLDLPRPYRPAHRLFASVSEWRAVKGVTSALFDKLRDSLTVLPEATLVNVQTASAPLLMSLSDSITADVAEALLNLRKNKPFVSTDVFLNSDIIKSHPVESSKITVVSQYFLIETVVNIEDQHSVTYTLVNRMTNQGKPDILILWQSKGVW